jgi:branched-chain amino acid transport system permease protein
MTLPVKDTLTDSLKVVRGYIIRAYTSFFANVFDNPPRLLAFLCLITLLALPICWFNFSKTPKYLEMLSYASILAILGVSWDLLVGRTGQVSLGHAFFFGIGSYASGMIYQQIYGFSRYIATPAILLTVLVAVVIGVLLAVSIGLRRAMRIVLLTVLVAVVIGVLLAVSIGFWITIPVWLITMPAAIATGAILAVLLGLPALRVKGPYLGLFTMCIPLVVLDLTTWPPLAWLTGSNIGLKTPRVFEYPIGTLAIFASVKYYLMLTILLISAVIIYKIATSKTGIVFVSILDNELASKACGINVTKYKLLAFMISGIFGTVAGFLFSHVYSYNAHPTDFSLTYSFLPITVTFLGGLGTIYGPIAGAYIYVILDQYVLPNHIIPWAISMGIQISRPIETKNIIFALILITFIIKWPRGIARTIVDKLNDLAKPRDIEERGPRIWKKYRKEQKESRLRKIFSRFKKKPKGNESEVKT